MPEQTTTQMKKSKDAIMGIDNIGFFRLLSEDHTKAAQLIPHQTSFDFDMSRDADSTATKDGSIAVPAGLETELTNEFIDSISYVSDAIATAILNGEQVEIWMINRRRKNTAGKYFGWYIRGYVTEDSGSNDADDASTREITFNATGAPKRGWVTLTKEMEEEIDFGFRGLAAITSDDATGDGTAWTSADTGTGELVSKNQ
jgi:TP901-1 family phage major tail protein|nr:MAG TPA: major tail protein [Caudoviricetes sp.]